jgi:ribonuclease HII
MIKHIPGTDCQKDPDFDFEQQLWSKGLQFIAGVDEAGRGALAGPVVAGAVIFDPKEIKTEKLAGVRDSKQMTSKQRFAWAEILVKISLTSSVGFASVEEIDQQGIVNATRLAMRRAIETLDVTPAHLLIDYLSLPDLKIGQTCIVKGDVRSLSIAAASILAKTTRDTHMVALDQDFPGYGFAKHKGYGTLAHREMLTRLGPCEFHRKTFAPLCNLIREKKFPMKEGEGVQASYGSNLESYDGSISQDC